jgi:deoxyribose-phosphate aldolase
VITRAELAALIDHTLLAPEATADDVAALCAEAGELGVGAVCVSASMVATAHRYAPAGAVVCAVIGFPTGAHRHEAKAFEADLALADGARELDMVVDLGAVRAHDWSAVEADVAAVRARTDLVLKVIVESAVLDPDELDHVARVAVDAGGDLLKTSTGFHPRGGATIDSVAALARVAGDASSAGRVVGVKASGGIRDAATALAMLEAGATRLGCSSSRAILDGLDALDNSDTAGR